MMTPAEHARLRKYMNAALDILIKARDTTTDSHAYMAWCHAKQLVGIAQYDIGEALSCEAGDYPQPTAQTFHMDAAMERYQPEGW